MSERDGGSVFPVLDDNLITSSTGLSIRDWFAGQALAGLIMQSAIDKEGTYTMPLVAEYAYAVADAMLAARKETDHG